MVINTEQWENKMILISTKSWMFYDFLKKQNVFSPSNKLIYANIDDEYFIIILDQSNNKTISK